MQWLGVLSDVFAMSVMVLLTYEICMRSRESCRVAVVGFAVIAYAVLNRYMERRITLWEILGIFLIILYVLLR